MNDNELARHKILFKLLSESDSVHHLTCPVCNKLVRIRRQYAISILIQSYFFLKYGCCHTCCDKVSSYDRDDDNIRTFCMRVDDSRKERKRR